MLSMWASKNYMCCCFFCRLTDLTNSVVHNPFPSQCCLALDSFLGQQPSEELDSWWGFVIPNEVCPFIVCGVSALQCPVQYSGIQISISFEHHATPLILAFTEVVLVHDRSNLKELLLSLNGDMMRFTSECCSSPSNACLTVISCFRQWLYSSGNLSAMLS